MRISLVRTGGYAGVRLATSVDTRTLSTEDAKQLEEWVSQAGFFSLPSSIQPANSQPDRFQYTLSVEDNGRKNSISVSETVLPPSLRSLVDYLVRLARRNRPQ